MKLYHLTISDDYEGYAGYDCWHVIRASSEKRAREMAPHGDEGGIWGDPSKTNYRVLTADGAEEFVISDFSAA